MMYVLRCGSRNGMNELRDSKEFRNNYNRLLGCRIPHMDSVNAILKQISPQELEELQIHLVRLLLDKRVLHKFKLLSKYFIIAVDGTGVFTYDKEPYSGCPYKTSKNGKKTYHQPVVSAKLICANGFSIELCSEWVVNEDGATKQDCEYKATKRLLEKLRAYFYRLPICILMDGLFLNEPMQRQIIQYKWEFIMVWKDKSCYTLQDIITQRRVANQLDNIEYTEFDNSKKRSEYNLEYSSLPLDHKGIQVYYLKGEKQSISIDPHTENVNTRYMFMSSIPVNRQNVKQLFTAGRLRWKIENEGFNTQKNSGLALHHKMNQTKLGAMKNYYTCLQIAHLISQLLTLAKNSIAHSYRTSKKVWADFWAMLKFLEHYEPIPLNAKYNLRY